MSLKFYTLFTLLFIVLLGNFVYFFVTKESAPLDIFGIHLSAYPVAIWVTLPFFLFYILNVILMSVNSVQSYLKLRNYERDFDKLLDAFYHGYLRKTKSFEYKTERYQTLGRLVEHSILLPKPDASIEEPAKISKLFELIHELDKGTVVDLRRYGLSKDNPLMVENAKNLLKSDVKSAESILSHSENYDDATLKEAYETYAQEASAAQLIKYKNAISMPSLLTIISRLEAEEKALEMNMDELFELCTAGAFDAASYVHIARALKTAMVPEDRMKLFERLSEAKEEAAEAELYTLLDLEMIEQAKDLLENYTSDDFPRYRAFLALKECHTAIDIDQLIE